MSEESDDVTEFSLGGGGVRRFPEEPPNVIEAADADMDYTRNSGSYQNITDKNTNATSNADYGLTLPNEYQRWLAVQSLPIAWKITFGVAADAFKSGEEFPFKFGKYESGGGEFEETSWSQRMLTELRDVKAFRTLQQATAIGRMDGEAIILLLEDGFDWSSDMCKQPRDLSKPIVEVMTLPMFYVYKRANVSQKDMLANGYPRYWSIRMASADGLAFHNVATKEFHYSRVLHYNPDRLDTSTKGLSVLERCWQALMIGWNIDYGTGEAYFRWGHGHPSVLTDFENVEELKDMLGKIDNFNPTRRTWHAWTKHVRDFKMVGVSGSEMNVESAKERAVYDEIAMGSNIPRPILKGELAGVLTGSEVNERAYFSTLRQVQLSVNPLVWKLVTVLNESNGLDVADISRISGFNDGQPYRLRRDRAIAINWAVHYVETGRERMDSLMQKVNIINGLTNVMTIGEVREMMVDLLELPSNFLDEIPEDVSKQILPLYQPPAPEMGMVEGGGETVSAECRRCGKVFTPRGNERVCPACQQKMRTREKEPDPHGEKSRRKKDPVYPDRTQQTGESRKDSGDDWTAGCIRHEHFHANCPECRINLRARKDAALNLLNHGHSANSVRGYYHLGSNVVNELRATLDEINKREEK